MLVVHLPGGAKLFGGIDCETHLEHAGAAVAIVVSDDLTFGGSRFYKALMDEVARVRIFRDMDEAVEWLTSL